MIAYINDLDNYRNSASRLFDMMEKGLAGTVGTTYALTETVEAHHALETGKSSGSLLLIPRAGYRMRSRSQKGKA